MVKPISISRPVNQTAASRRATPPRTYSDLIALANDPHAYAGFLADGTRAGTFTPEIEQLLEKYGAMRARQNGKTNRVAGDDGAETQQAYGDGASTGPGPAAPAEDPAGRAAAPLAATNLMGLRVRALDRGNIGTIIADNGATCDVHFDGTEGSATVPLAKSELKRLDNGRLLSEPDAPAAPPIQPIPITQLARDYPTLREPVIDGLLRVGETANIIAAPKVGKSWSTYGLALSISAGQPWLGRFGCPAGKVLLYNRQ